MTSAIEKKKTIYSCCFFFLADFIVIFFSVLTEYFAAFDAQKGIFCNLCVKNKKKTLYCTQIPKLWVAIIFI